jgi:predicted nucleotidyltransferase
MNTINYHKTARWIVNALKKSKPEKIILFGSTASGKIKPNSDLDLCIIKQGNPLEIKKNIWDILTIKGYGWEIEPDIHVYSSAIFSDYLKRNDPFIEEIAKVKTLYERPIHRTI